MMKYLPNSKEFIKYGTIALLTIFAVNNFPQVKSVVKPNA